MTQFRPSRAALALAVLFLLSACSIPAPAPAIRPASPTLTATSAPTSNPSPTSTLAPTFTPTPITGEACLMGKWQVNDPADFVNSLTAQTKATAQVLNDAGPITYQFNPDGTTRVTVDQFRLKMKIPVRGLPLNLDVMIDGTATADYVPYGSDRLTFSNAQLDGLKVSAKAGQRELFAGTAKEMADLFGFTLDPLFNTSMYDCRADTFKYRPLPNTSAVILKRVQ